MESSRSTSPCSSRETISSSSARAASKLNSSTARTAPPLFSAIASPLIPCSSRHQRPHMGRRRAGRRIQVISPLERGNNAALTASLGQRTNDFGGPAKIAFVQAQLRQRVVAVGVEAGGYDDKLRLKSRERRQNHELEGAAEFLAAGSGRKRHVDNVVGNTGFIRPAGARIERRLMSRAVKQVRIAGEHVLRAIAVMDVEIHHRDTLQSVNGPCMQRADSNIVEQAKTHCARGRGMMARRAHGAERILYLPSHHQIQPPANRAANSP